MIGVAGSVIYNIVRGKTKPSYDLMEKMVSLFNINPSYLINGTGNILTVLNTDNFDETLNYETNVMLKKVAESIELDHPLIDKLLRAVGSTKMANEYTDIMGNTDLLTSYLSHYDASIFMIDIAKQYRLGKITYKEFKSIFKNSIELQKQLYEKIKPFAKTINEIYQVVSDFNDKHDKLYSLEDSGETTD